MFCLFSKSEIHPSDISKIKSLTRSKHSSFSLQRSTSNIVMLYKVLANKMAKFRSVQLIRYWRFDWKCHWTLCNWNVNIA